MYYNISPKLILFIVLFIMLVFTLSCNLTILAVICGTVIVSILYDWYDEFTHIDYFKDECGYLYDSNYGEYNQYYNQYNTSTTVDYSKYQPKTKYKPYIKPMPLKIQADIMKQIVPNMSFELKGDKNCEKRQQYKKLLEMSEENLADYLSKLPKNDEKVETVKPTFASQHNEHHAPLLLEAPKTPSVPKVGPVIPTIAPKATEAPTLHTFIVMQNTNYLGDIREKVYNTIITHLRSLYLASSVMETILNNISYIDVIKKNGEATHEIVIFVKDFKIFSKYEINFDIIIDKIINLPDLKLSVVMEKLQTKTIFEYYKERG